MRVIAFRKLREFWENPEFSETETSLRVWYHEVKNADWTDSNEIKAHYQSASIIGGGRIVFNIKGNAYRLVAAFDYQRQIAFIRFIGTHKEYEKINAKMI